MAILNDIYCQICDRFITKERRNKHLYCSRHLHREFKNEPIDTVENRIKFWINFISNDQGPLPDNLYDYDYNDEGLDYSVCGAVMFPDIGELKNLLDILRCK